MVFHYSTSPSSGSYREILVRLTALCTSKNVTAAVVNAGGSGYVVGDLLNLTHASAYGDCVLEVATLSGSAVATVKVRSAGAFARRVGAVVINAAGTGYAAGDVVEVVSGTATEKAKVKVLTVGGGGAAATVAVFETGGAYSADPTTTACATDSSVGTGSGTGLTVNITMQAIAGSTGRATTAITGVGTGATFDITLVQGGWTCLRNWNKFSVNSINDEKELVMQGTAGTGGNDPIVGVRTYTQTSGLNTRYGWVPVCMDNFNSGLALTSQPGVGPSAAVATGAKCLLMFDNAQPYWMSVDGRSVEIVIKAVGLSITTYMSAGFGLLDPFGTVTENPYPAFVYAGCGTPNRAPDSGGFFVTGPTECFCDATNTKSMAFRRPSDGTWVDCANSVNGTASATNMVTPVGVPSEPTSSAEDDLAHDGNFNIYGSAALVSGSAATTSLMPTVSDNQMELYPANIVSSPGGTSGNDSETTPRGQIPRVYWLSVTKSDGSTAVAEDTVTVGSQRYRIFQNAHRTERYSYFALKES